ncbi:MAG: alpha/beta hydrolase family protein [Planctomycetaceae bacterium]
MPTCLPPIAARRLFLLQAGLLAVCCLVNSRPAWAQPAPVKTLILPGESFLVAERPAFILWPEPKLRRQPQPWVCYAPTLPPYPDEHEKWMHQRFLEAGVAVCGIDVGEAYGNRQGREWFSKLHEELTERRGFARQTCLLGRSRGGLWVTAWAAEHPERVSGLAGIYPVFDLRSYPGLERAAPAFQLSPKELEQQLPALNPINRVAVLAQRAIPVCLIHGDQDEVVPLAQNSAAFAEVYRQADAGKHVQLIVAKGQGHNYWEGFFRSPELVEFVIARAKAGATAPPKAD